MEVVSSYEDEMLAAVASRSQPHVDFQIPSTSARFVPRLVNSAQNPTSIISESESVFGAESNPMTQNDRIDPWISDSHGNHTPNTVRDLAYIDAATIPNPTLTETDIDEILTIFNEEIPDLYQYI